MMTTKLFIVDDHYMIIEGIRSLIQHDGIEWIGHAMNASFLSCIPEKPTARYHFNGH